MDRLLPTLGSALFGAGIGLLAAFASTFPNWFPHGHLELWRLWPAAVVGALAGGALGLWGRRPRTNNAQDPPELRGLDN